MDKKNAVKFKLKTLLLVAAANLFLSACTPTSPPIGTTLADGPPLFSVDVSKIHDAVPKNEPKSLYGNPRSYVAMGHRYYVLNSAQGYSKRGLASWYGTKFQGRLTSTHERYDLLSMTAASPDLPLPCYARVTNLENGRQVIVKVNDRGPFASNRVMDLSYAAAKKLGYSGKGTAHVQVTAINPNTYMASAGQERYPQRAYSYRYHLATNNDNRTVTLKRSVNALHHPHVYLQVGAFARAQNANQLKSQIAMFTQKPIRINRIYRNKHPIYQVQVGPFLNSRESIFLSQKLKQRGLYNTHSVILG